MADVTLESSGSTAGNENSGDGRCQAWPSSTHGYYFYINSSENLVYRETTDSGATWSATTTIKSFSSTAGGGYSVWADWWTPGDTGTVIHVGCAAGGNGEFEQYRSLDTSSNTLGTIRTVHNGGSMTSSTSANNRLSLTKTRGGNLLYAYCVDGDSADFLGFYRSTDSGVNWTSRAALWESGAFDMVLLFPGDNADNQDGICIFWDISANEISRKNYDDSDNTWTEASIATSMTAPSKANVWPGMAATIKDNNTIILVAFSDYDVATADLKCWYITGTNITGKTDVFSNSDDVGAPAILYDQNTGDIYVAWLGKKDGSETITNDVHVYRSKSSDGASTWGTPVQHDVTNDDHRLLSLDLGGTSTRVYPIWFNDDLNDHLGNFDNGIAIIVPTAAITGTVTASITEADIVAGGKTIIITLTGDTWIAAGVGSFDLQRDEIIAGIDSAQSETLGWDAVPKATQSLGGVVRTSDTVVTITLDAFATYDITAQETITVTIPSTALVIGAGSIIATPSFTISIVASSVTVTPGLIALVTSLKIPQVNLGIIPGKIDLVTSFFVPVIAHGIVVPKVDLVTAPFAPLVVNPQGMAVPLIALVTSGKMPVVGLGIVPGFLTLTTASFAPVLNLTVIPGLKALTTTLFVPSPNIGVYVTPGVKDLVTASFALVITLSDNQLIVPGVQSLITTLYAPVPFVPIPTVITPGLIALVLATYNPVIAARIFGLAVPHASARTPRERSIVVARVGDKPAIPTARYRVGPP